VSEAPPILVTMSASDLVNGLPVLRRASFPVSPRIGPEGARAVRELLAAARELFLERGYHSPSVSAIAERAGRSDAAVYQYFSGKHEIFRIFFTALGDDLAAHFEALPAITGDATGRDAFRIWVRGTGEILHRHGPVFMEWPSPDEEDHPADNPQERYFARFVGPVSARLAGVDTGGVGARALSVAIIAIIAYAHVTLQARRAVAGAAMLDTDELDDAVAAVVHAAFFPAPRARDDSTTPTSPTPVDSGTFDHGAELPGLRRPATGRSRATVERLLEAARSSLADRGMDGTSVKDLVTRAGVAHGTFYRYWDDRESLLATLTALAETEVRRHWSRLPAAVRRGETAEWLTVWGDVLDTHGTTLHLWTVELEDHPSLRARSRDVGRFIEDIARRVCVGSPVLGDLSTRAASIVLWTILVELPHVTTRRFAILASSEVVDLQMLLLRRGIIGDRP
jgi:AcrR family transcriptional regulator